MIQRYGRLICVLAIVALWIPLTVNLMNPVAAPLVADNRTIAKFPAKPADLLEWLLFSRNMETYVNDNFGFRHQMVAAYSTFRFIVRSPVNEKVTFGRDEWLYFTENSIFEQSRGQIYRASRVKEFVDIVVHMNDLVTAAGGRMIVAIPPNRHSVATEHLPSWALRFEGSTEYDAILELLALRDVAAIDLRPVLWEGKAIGPVYRPRNTHWTSLGALLAFNAVAADLDHPEWIIDPADVFRGTKASLGDLAGMIGVSDIAPDIDTSLDLSNYRPDRVDTTNLDDFPTQPSYIVDTSNGGETVLVMGDSFSRGIMKDFFTARAGRLAWTHFRWCGFDWSLFEKNLPATVIVMPVERYALCGEGEKPLNFPARRGDGE